LAENNKEVFILDTSALLAYIEDEDGAEYAEDLLTKAESNEITLYIAFVSLTEVMYITLQEKDEGTAQARVDLIKSLSCTIEESSESLNFSAARLKAKNRISLADAYIAALCQKQNGILVHKDPEFEKLSPAINQHKLPYK
jgi:predicted nucleic acid-binding protein